MPLAQWAANSSRVNVEPVEERRNIAPITNSQRLLPVVVMAALWALATPARSAIREIEVLPKASTEWWLVPIKTGQFGDLKCPEQGHTESGMVGQIVIK